MSRSVIPDRHWMSTIRLMNRRDDVLFMGTLWICPKDELRVSLDFMSRVGVDREVAINQFSDPFPDIHDARNVFNGLIATHGPSEFAIDHGRFDSLYVSFVHEEQRFAILGREKDRFVDTGRRFVSRDAASNAVDDELAKRRSLNE